MFAAASAARDRTLLVVPTDADVERMTRGRALLLRRARRALGRRGRARRPAVPVARSRSVPRPGAALRHRLGARARAARAARRATARLVVASAAALLPRRQRARAPRRRSSLTLTPGQDISPIDLGDLLAAAGYTRQDPVDESGEFCVRGGVVDFYPAGARAAAPARVHRRHDRVDPHLRSRDAAIDRRARSGGDRPAAGADRRDDETSAGSIGDGLRLPVGRRPARRPRLGAGRSARARREADAADRAPATTKRSRKGSARGAAIGADRVAGTTCAALARRRHARSRRSRSARTRAARSRATSSCQPALEFAGRVQDWVAEIRRGRERGDTIVFVANTRGPRRAHDRAARRLRHLRGADRARRRRATATAVLVGDGHLSRGFRLPDAGLQLWAETDVFEEERQGSRAPALGHRARSSPTSAT